MAIHNREIKLRILRKNKTGVRVEADLILLKVLQEFYKSINIDVPAKSFINRVKRTPSILQFEVKLNEGHKDPFLYALLQRETRIPVFKAYLIKHKIKLSIDTSMPDTID